MALKGNQKKLDKNNNNRIDAQDFKILKAEKAKGRGMGLQDEKVKPGKVIKAKRGTGILAEKGTSKNFAGYTKVFEGPRDKGRVATISGVKPKIKKSRKTYKSMDEMRKAKGFKPGETAKDFNKRRLMLAGAKEAAKATRIGKIVLPIAAAGVAAQQYLKSKMKKKDKKMGGGMMKKYNRGGMYLSDEKIKKVFPEKNAKRRAIISQLVGGDRVSPMKKDRFEAGQSARRKQMLKDFGKKMAKTTPMGLGIKVAETAKKIKEKMSKKMGGGMMKRPMGYKAGMSIKGDNKRDIRKTESMIGASKSSPREKSIKKRMGGGMMQRPMQYKAGTMIKARGGGIARSKPTKMY